MNRDRLIEELPVAGAFARVITRSAVRARQRVLLHVLSPGGLVVACLREVEPRLDVLASRAGLIAGRKMIDVVGTLPSTRASALADRLLVVGRQILGNETHIFLRTQPFTVIGGSVQTAYHDEGLEGNAYGVSNAANLVDAVERTGRPSVGSAHAISWGGRFRV